MQPEIEHSRKTIFVPVVTMEEAPLLSEAECAKMRASLAEAEADVAEGRGQLFDAETFVADAMARRAQLVAKKTV